MTVAHILGRVRLVVLLLNLTALVATPFSIVQSQERGRAKSVRPGVDAPGARTAARWDRPSARAAAWADAQLRRMSLDEKIGQLVAIGVNGRYLNQDSEAFRALRRQVEENHVGGIVLYRGPVYESVHLANRLQNLSRYPLLVSADMEFGAAMRFDDTLSLPWNMAFGATGNPLYARRQGEIIAREARALGVRHVFGPVADVNNNPANPVINVRAYSEDPAEVARFAAAFVRGAQSNGVMATAKHFPGHGDTAVDSHRGLPVVNFDRARLDGMELVPFRAAIAAGVGSVMAAYIGMPKIDPTVIEPLPRDRSNQPAYGAEGSEIIAENATLPAALSPVVIDGLLRRDLHFGGLVVSDALDMSGLTLYFNQDEAAVRAVQAGVDMLIKPSDPDAAVRGLRQAVGSGRLTEARVEQSARRILAAKYDLGLVRRRITPLDRVDRFLSNAEAVAFADEVAQHAITLVRDAAGLVPLKLRPDARVFNLVITNGDDRSFIAIPFVAELARKGRRVETAVLDGRSSEEEIREALRKAQEADLVIASLYGRVRTGEARSIGLPEPSADALAELVKSKAAVIGISFGNPYLLQSFPGLRTYVIAYGDMPSLQAAAARALLGEADITGRLPITLPSLYPRGAGIQLKARARGDEAGTASP